MYNVKKKKQNHPGYTEWNANHIYSLNHAASSGAMESAGVVKIFNRSVEKNDLIYKYYLGDGDFSVYNDVLNNNPYRKFQIEP